MPHYFLTLAVNYSFFLALILCYFSLIYFFQKSVGGGGGGAQGSPISAVPRALTYRSPPLSVRQYLLFSFFLSLSFLSLIFLIREGGGVQQPGRQGPSPLRSPSSPFSFLLPLLLSFLSSFPFPSFPFFSFFFFFFFFAGGGGGPRPARPPPWIRA